MSYIDDLLAREIPAAINTIAKWIENGGTLPEYERARIHAATCPHIPTAEEWRAMDLDARIHELVQWVKENGPETARARIHALTRKVTMSDEDLKASIGRLHREKSVPIDDLTSLPPKPSDYLGMLQDLRDRYEERGKYAPESAPLPEFPKDRCRVCGWPLATDMKAGCIPGNCSQRPAPAKRADEGYAPE